MKNFLDLSLSTRLAIKITIILIISFFSVVGMLLFIQFWMFQQNNFAQFSKTAGIFMESLLKSNILENPNLEQFIEESEESYIFQPFDSNGYRLSDTIIFDKNSQKIIVNEYLYLDEKDKLEIVNIPDKHPLIRKIGDFYYFLYKIEYNNYSIVHATISLNFFEYYAGLFSINNIIVWISISIFAALAFSFSRMIINPIQEQNIALALYNKNLAHELKTPLSVIQSDLEMLELTGEKKFINSSREELQHIAKIIDALLFLVQKSNKTSLSFENLKNIIFQISKKFPHIHTVFHKKNENVKAYINKELFTILIENIFENAEKYGKTNEIFITITQKMLIFKNPVEKNLSKKDLKNIEEIFYQIDDSRNSQGYGLGIPMMKKIVESFGWKMILESKNKTFCVKICYK